MQSPKREWAYLSQDVTRPMVRGSPDAFTQALACKARVRPGRRQMMPHVPQPEKKNPFHNMVKSPHWRTSCTVYLMNTK